MPQAVPILMISSIPLTRSQEEHDKICSCNTLKNGGGTVSELQFVSSLREISTVNMGMSPRITRKQVI
jgi:hypothetical protein